MGGHSQNNRLSGFTLLELSIVLVIIGLIVGSITVGQNMIRSAELNSVISDVDEYTVAMNTFKIKHVALPGDMDNAEDFWSSGANCIDGSTLDTTGGTCNGNGDRAYRTTHLEQRVFWQHLSLSGIVPGNYTGMGTFIPGENVPSLGGSKVISVATPSNISYFVVGAIRYDVPSGRSTINIVDDGVFTPGDAHSIDLKVDDGVAGTGDVIGDNGSSLTNCLSSGEYNLSASDRDCILQFRMF